MLTAEEALKIWEEGKKNRPGKWVHHSRHVADTARRLAVEIPGLDPERAFVLGLLHDIGKSRGKGKMKHIIRGYRFMEEMGQPEVARICLTHSFPIPEVDIYLGKNDCTKEEIKFIKKFLKKHEMNDEDRLIQLSDALSDKDGPVLLEKRMVNISIRHGYSPRTVEKWQKVFEIKEHFEKAMGKPLYSLLPEVVDNTFDGVWR
jgi:putative nucleotidyltransferase with HDIG domain